MTIEQVTAFLGWTTLINIVLLALMTVALIVAQERVTAIHAKLFSMDQASIKSQYFHFLSNYKLLITVFNLAPYLALRIIHWSVQS